MKNLVIDLDGTITQADTTDYADVTPNTTVIEKLREYRSSGFSITIATSRNMRRFAGNIGKINVHTLPVIIRWLDKHNVPYDEIVLGKPWCGFDGFYVDDKSIRPSEFMSMNEDEIKALLEKERSCS